MTVELRQLTPAAEEGWATLFALADETTKEWMLVGGQMVFVLAVERGRSGSAPPRTSTSS